jgi:hypothetical protein
MASAQTHPSILVGAGSRSIQTKAACNCKDGSTTGSTTGGKKQTPSAGDAVTSSMPDDSSLKLWEQRAASNEFWELVESATDGTVRRPAEGMTGHVFGVDCGYWRPEYSTQSWVRIPARALQWVCLICAQTGVSLFGPKSSFRLVFPATNAPSCSPVRSLRKGRHAKTKCGTTRAAGW